MDLHKVFPLISVLLSICNCFEDKTILQYMNETSNYSLLARLMKEAKLDSLLDGAGPYTILAPSNAALANLDPDTMVALGHNDLLLKNVMNYHILNGFQLIPEFKAGKEEKSLNGQTIHVDIVQNSIILNNSTKITSTRDVVLKNGVIHPIDSVLIPPVFSTHNLAAELVLRNDVYEFFNGMLILNFTSLIEGGEYTIFAPTDAAVTNVYGTLLYQNMPHILHYFVEAIKYHIVPGARTSSQLKDGDILYTLHGTPIHIKKSNIGVFAEDGRVIEADIGASNGVIHIVDKLLYPADLLEELQKELQNVQQ